MQQAQRRGFWGISLAAALFLASCGKDKEAAAPAASRFDAVMSKGKQEKPLEEFCDVRPNASSAPTFLWPELASAPPQTKASWRWINVWATWCKPCIEEMPLLGQWQTRLQKEGKAIALEFLSIDSNAEDITQYTREHPSTPSSLRIASQDKLAPWIGALGLDAGATIPIHVFVNPQGKIRCVRTGSINTSDYNVITRILSEP